MNTQNMIVLTVEFTRIPLSRREKIHNWTSLSAHITLRRVKLTQSHRKYKLTGPSTLTHRRPGEQ